MIQNRNTDTFTGEEHKIAADNNGNDDQIQPHGNHQSKAGEQLNDKGLDPVVPLVAVIHGHAGDEQRRGDIQQQNVENSDNKRKDADGHNDDEGDAGNIAHQIVHFPDIKIFADLRHIIIAFFTGDIAFANGVVKVSGIEHGVLCGLHAHNQENKVVCIQRAGGCKMSSFNRRKLSVGSNLFADCVERCGNILIISIQIQILGQVCGSCQQSNGSLP